MDGIYTLKMQFLKLLYILGQCSVYMNADDAFGEKHITRQYNT